ncbi:HNH endonuclease [Burkholderia stagnalis]|uniref:HNH endonuclease n=1 Tax=Burkholderia stagnalis TaxID=1503054 RepID=UPI0018C5210A|nr:HNH endonuclease [Burkholderia stagnalis]
MKPELFTHEDLFEAEQETGLPLRIAFVGLFTCADREGRFKWRPRTLKLAVLPHDQVDFSRVLDALTTSGFVRKYVVDGEPYGFIPTFLKHQTINQREAKSTLPAPGNDACTATHVHAHADDDEDGAYEYRGENVAPALRETILARDGYKCRRCPSTEDLTVDHIFPRSIGGTHAPANLRTLCRSCNSARPVQGQALIDDLARDGFTLDDMQRTCMHVHAHGEGKGKEGKGRKEANASVDNGAGAPPVDPAGDESGEGDEDRAGAPDGADLLGDQFGDDVGNGGGVRLICPVERIVAAYHHHMPDNPRVKVLNDKRKRAIAARWREAAKLECKPFG